MQYKESLATKEQEKLREQIRLLSTKVDDDIYQQRQHLFGRVATIIEAAIGDPEQRKSIKDLVSEAIYGSSYWNHCRHQFEQFAEAQGFKLWANPSTLNTALAEPINEYAKV